MAQELLFELDNVRITPHVAQFGGTSYQMSTIGSVRVVGRRKRNPVAVLLFLAGLALLVAAIVIGTGREPPGIDKFAAAIGLGGIVAAMLLQLVWPRRVFTVMLKTSSGDIAAFSSRKKHLVFNVKQAVEQAFIARSPQRS